MSLITRGLQLRTYNTFLEESSVYSGSMKTFGSMQGNAIYKPYIIIIYTQNTSISDSINFAVNTSKIVKIANAQEKRFFHLLQINQDIIQ